MIRPTHILTCDCLAPLPLIKTNFLSEFHTEADKAKARANLGIADDLTLKWENIKGNVEDNESVSKYIDKLLEYRFINENITEEITSVLEALDFMLEYISGIEAKGYTFEQLSNNIKKVASDLNTEKTNLLSGIDANLAKIDKINEELTKINKFITELDIDGGILTWLRARLQNSKTIEINEDLTIEAKISKEDKNALNVKDDGLHVADYSLEVSSLQEGLEKIEEALEGLKDSVGYNPKLDENTTSSIVPGLTVKDLAGKSLSEILDLTFFPAVIPILNYPTLTPSKILPTIVEVGDPIDLPTYTFELNDAGNLSQLDTVVTLNGEEFTDSVFSTHGDYKIIATAYYNVGEYLKNNRGEETSLRIEAGNISNEMSVAATYPWYYGKTGSLTKHPTLVPLKVQSNELEISLTGFAVIEIPGSKSKITSFKLNSGLGILDVNMEDWEGPEKVTKNGISYLRYVKKSSYSAIVPHIIKFRLEL